MIVTYERGGKATRIEIPDEKDWADVAERVRAEIFPGVRPPLRDRRFEEIGERRRQADEADTKRSKADKRENVKRKATEQQGFFTAYPDINQR